MLKYRFIFIFLISSLFMKAQTNPWQQVFVPPNSTYVFALASIGNTIYAGGYNGIHASVDNGQTWNNILQGFEVSTLLADGNNLYAGGSSLSGGTVYASPNAGTSWTDISPYGFVFGNSIKSIFVYGGFLYIGAVQAQGIYRCPLSNLASNAWTTYITGFSFPPQGATLAYNGTALMAGMFSGGVYTTSPSANPAWSLSATGIVNSMFLRALTVTGSTCYIGASGTPQMHKSVNGGSTWTPLNSSAFDISSQVFSILTNSNHIYAGTDLDGVMYSNDAGTTWAPHNQGLKDPANNWFCNNMRVYSLLMKGDTLFAATSCGIWRSSGCSNPLNMSTQSELSVCSGNSTTLTATGLGALNWYPALTSTNSIGTGSLFSTPALTANTTYYVQNDFCQAKTPLTVTVNATPTVAVMASTGTVCAGSSATLTAFGANTYLWSNAVNSSVNVVTPQNMTVYTVTGTSAAGCPDSQSITVYVLPAPDVTLSATSSVVCQGESVMLNASGANTYTWNSLYESPTIEVVLFNTIVFTVTAVGPNGCAKTQTMEISVAPCTQIEEEERSQEAGLCFPNPGSGIVTFKGLENGDRLEIIDGYGRVIIKRVIQDSVFTLDLEGSAKGIYTYRLTNSAGEIKSGKIILE